jgi:hypothetical protein
MLDDIRSANNFDPFTPARFENWMDLLANLDPLKQAEILQLSGVRWRAGEANTGTLGVIYEDLGEATTARLIPRAVPVQNPEDALKILALTSFDGTSEILIETERAEFPVGGSGEVEVLTQENPNQVQIDMVSSDGAWLLLSESWYPGWKVYIGGEQAELYRADYLFMGVWVPAGQHRVEFSYRPSFFIPAAMLTAVAWIGVGFWRVRSSKE